MIDKEEQRIRLLVVISKLQNQKFYGEVTLKFYSGDIVQINKIIETIKLENIEDGKKAGTKKTQESKDDKDSRSVFPTK